MCVEAGRRWEGLPKIKEKKRKRANMMTRSFLISTSYDYLMAV